MSLSSSNANYNGRQPNNTSYIKTFVPGSLSSSETGAWTTDLLVYPDGQSKEVIRPVYTNYDVYIPQNLVVGKSIIRYETQENIINVSQSNNEVLSMKLNELERKVNQLTAIVNNLLSTNINGNV
mgnify:CR=1 FL=1